MSNFTIRKSLTLDELKDKKTHILIQCILSYRILKFEYLYLLVYPSLLQSKGFAYCKITLTTIILKRHSPTMNTLWLT